MRNTKANRTKFLQGYLKILLSWKDKKQDVKEMKKCLEELNLSLPTKRKVKLCIGVDDLRSNLGPDLWSNLGSNLGSDLWSDLRSDLGSDLGSDLRSDLRSNLGSDLWSETWEYYEFIWPVFVGHFYKDLPTIKRRSKTIEALDKCIKAGVGYLWLSSTTLYALPFPKISIDGEKRLHCEDGPACKWSAKEKSWWFHGVKVNQKIIETPEKLTKKDWSSEDNAEIRRVIQERMGNDFVTKIGGKKIDTGKWGNLIEVNLKDDPEKVARYVNVKDSSTARQYYLRVPPTIEKADEGIAWTFGFEAKDYKLEQEG